MGFFEEALAELTAGKGRFDAAVEMQAAVWRGETQAHPPILLTCLPDGQFDPDIPQYNYKEIHFDREKMLHNGLREALLCARGGAEAVPSMRANMGCGIIPTAFGITQGLYEDKMPWVTEHLPKEQLMKMGPEDLTFSSELTAAFGHMEYMAERLEGTGCRIFPLDVQGAFDTAHIVYGDAIFYDLYDDPDFVHHLLGLCCHAITLCLDECLRRIPGSGTTIAHYNGLGIPRSLGGIKLSEDTSTLLSKAQIDEFVTPYLTRLLCHYGGGYVHYCGKNPHLFDAVMGLDKVIGLNFGNPEMHDMDGVLRRCAELGKVYYGSIPMLDGESLRQHFQRLLRQSSGGARHWVLPQFALRREETAGALALWRECAKGVG